MKPATNESTTHADPNLTQNANYGLESRLSEGISLLGGQPTEKTQHTLPMTKGEHVNIHVSLDGPKQTIIEDQLFHISSPLQTHGILDGPDFRLEEKTVGGSSRSHPESILEKIFGSTLSLKNDGHPDSVEVI